MLGTCTPDNKQKLDSISSFCEAYDPSARLEPIGARCTLWGGGGPWDIVLSGSGRLVHGPLDGRCKARNWNTLIPLVPVLRFRACPSVWSVLHIVGQRSLHLLTNYDGSPGTLSSTLFFSLVRGPDPHKGGGSRLNISAISGNFSRIRSAIPVHPG
ncbi:unnamed protein product [Vicia faba]|uniref:Uncharacterized protein n=1 Tax=Vicia faba TaxID=3906 RepID=A0AAV1ALH4_VICFA|nr:unnamed protein product [Vicia faba]